MVLSLKALTNLMKIRNYENKETKFSMSMK